MKAIISLVLIALLTACSAEPKEHKEYANRDQILADLKRLNEARNNGDRKTGIKIAERLLSSPQTPGPARLTPLFYTAEIQAKEGNIDGVEQLFKSQFTHIMKSRGECSQSVYNSMKADIWKKAGLLDLAIRDYQSAIDLCPTMNNGYSKLSLIYASPEDAKHFDADKAIALAQKGTALKKDARSLFALAVAWAGTKDFPKAVTHMEAAVIAGEKERLPATEMDVMKQRLSQYRSDNSQGAR